MTTKRNRPRGPWCHCLWLEGVVPALPLHGHECPRRTSCNMNHKAVLKVSYGQTGSAWEWCHWIGLEKDIKHYRFLNFLISVLNVWKDLKVLSRFIQKWIQPPACWDHGLYRILSSYWLAQFYLLKKSALGLQLHYFDLDCGMLLFFKYSTHELKSKEQLLTFWHFWSTVGKDHSCAQCPYKPWSEQAGGWILFVWSSLEL
jgi:hypothetical protein